MNTVPWEIPATLNTLGNEVRDVTSFRDAVLAYRELPETGRANAEILFLFEKNEGALRGPEIDKYVALLE